MPYGRHEARPDEHVHLAGVRPLLGVEVPGQLQHHEEGAAEPLQLGPLVPLERVLNG